MRRTIVATSYLGAFRKTLILVGKTPIGRQLPVCRQASASLPLLLLLPMLVSQLPAVHRGVLFEKQALHVLQTYFSMSLHRVGGKDDGGRRSPWVVVASSSQITVKSLDYNRRLGHGGIFKLLLSNSRNSSM